MTAVAEVPRAIGGTAHRTGIGRTILAAACWTLLILAVLVTAVVIGQVLLALLLVGNDPTGSNQNVPLTVGVLVAVSAGLAALTARAFASPRAVGLATGSLVVLVFAVGVTWAFSVPDQVLFQARTMAFGESSPHDVNRFPQRPINNGSATFQFPQHPSPQLFQTIQYQQGGQLKQASLEEFLNTTQTTSFIVIKDGVVLDETYANGYTRDSIVTSFSVAKSFISALVGDAISDGYIGSIQDPIVMYLPELRGRGLDGVTIRDLLIMSSGTAFVHQDQQPWPLNGQSFNDDTRTTYYPNLRNLVLSVKPGADPPGTVFEYNKMVPGLLGVILERTTHRSVSQYLQDRIWQPLGMEYPASWSLDSTDSGFERMESGLNARAIDFAKFGQLYLDNGVWNGTQAVPAAWVAESTTADPNDNRPWRTFQPWKDANGYYKYLWWGRTLADGSYTFLAWGDRGQFIYVSPTDRVVIVRDGLVDGGIDSWADVFQSITAMARQGSPQ
jgi:CubicO group peptidase (beta-lactamase class C family)